MFHLRMYYIVIMLCWSTWISFATQKTKQCPEGSYWHYSDFNEVSECVQCYELCVYEQDKDRLLNNSDCYIVKQCHALLHQAYTSKCENGSIYDVKLGICKPCASVCAKKALSNKTETVCALVCPSYEIDNDSVILNGTIYDTYASKLGLIIGCTTFLCVLVIAVTVSARLWFKWKRVCSKSQTSKTEGTIHLSSTQSSSGYSSDHENDCDYNNDNAIADAPETKSTCVSILLETRENVRWTDKHAGLNKEVDEEHFTLISQEDDPTTQGNVIYSSHNQQLKVDPSNRPPVALSSKYDPRDPDITQNKHTQQESSKSFSPNKTPDIAQPMAYNVDMDDPISLDIFADCMLSYTSDAKATVASGHSTNLPSINPTIHRWESITGESLFSYVQQPDSILKLDCGSGFDSEKTHTSIYSFKETVYTEDDFKDQMDPNNKNAPHIKNADEHGLMTADEIEQLPTDLSDISDVQTKLQNLAQQQYIKRIISNGRYVKAWYDALDPINAGRLIGQILGLSKKHYGFEYVYKH